MWRYEMTPSYSYRVYEHTGAAGFAVPNRLLAGRIVDLLNADDKRRTESWAVAEKIGALLSAGGVRAELDKITGTV